MGIYDIPAMIDHIVEKTQVPKIHVVGYSQGTTAFFVMASEKPGYNDKVLSMNAMGPVVFEGEMTSFWIGLGKFFFSHILVTESR